MDLYASSLQTTSLQYQTLRVTKESDQPRFPFLTFQGTVAGVAGKGVGGLKCTQIKLSLLQSWVLTALVPLLAWSR